MTPSERRAVPLLPRALKRLTDYLSQDFLGGPRLIKLSWLLDIQKGGTFLFLGFLIWLYGNYSTAAFVYLALHGSYGLVWLIKSSAFPDGRWEKRVTIAGALVSSVLLLLYWSIGWQLISRDHVPVYPLPDAAWFCLCITVHTVGVALMAISDAQKYFTLRLRSGLITDGMFGAVRHPNFTGEIMIYGAYVLMLWHWYPALILAIAFVLVFWPSMHAIDSSLSRYPEWSAYRARTGSLLPRVF